MKAKTRWYNEAEKSNKNCLNLLKRNNVSSETCELYINGTITNNNENEIEKESQNYTQNSTTTVTM